MTNKHSYDLVDVVKFIACFCIVGIHTAVLSDLLSDNEYYYLYNGVFRLAVPFFFVASGFFFGLKSKDENTGCYIRRYVKRLLIPLIFWEMANIIIEILKQLFVQKFPVEKIAVNVLQSIIFYPYGALWYVQALLIAILIVNFAMRYNRVKMCVIIGFVLYLIGLLANTYYFTIVGGPVQAIIDRYLSIFVSSRNGIFVGLFFVSSGVYIAKNHEKVSRIKGWIALLIVSYIVFVCELVATKLCKSADDKSMYISFVILIPVLFINLLRYSKSIKFGRRLREYSTGIYFMHKVVIHIWLIVAVIIGKEISSTIQFILVSISCMVACFLSCKINNKYLNMLVK